jgi:hypothetical protein
MSCIVLLDYDGTVIKRPWESDERAEPTPMMDVIEKAMAFKEAGATLILWTCRENHLLDEAVEFCRQHGLELDYVNEGAQESKDWVERHYGRPDYMATRKIHGDIIVDDMARGSIEAFLGMDPEFECNEGFKRNRPPCDVSDSLSRCSSDHGE